MVSKRILVVDDDLAMGQVLTHNLRHEGFEVKWVTQGAAAIVEARSFAPDLVLLDVMLPDMTGFELAKVWDVERRWPIISAVGFPHAGWSRSDLREVRRLRAQRRRRLSERRLLNVGTVRGTLGASAKIDP